MKILSWNMGAAYGFRGDKHSAAWEWLNAQDADVALLQEVVPRPEFTSAWGSAVWVGKYQNWGSAVLSRAVGYTAWNPSAEYPWLTRVGGAVAVARPATDDGLWLASVHSDASSFEKTHKRYPSTYADLPSSEEVLRCSTKEMWEIEPIAHELRPVLDGRQFVLGGDLNSSLLFDTARKSDNAKLFENLRMQGYLDLGTKQGISEQQTYFKADTRPFQLDYLFGDAGTDQRVTSWRVLSEVAETMGLSDHAPVEIVLT